MGDSLNATDLDSDFACNFDCLSLHGSFDFDLDLDVDH